MEKLSNTILAFNSDIKIENRLRDARAMLAWNKVVGELISNNSEPARVRSGILYVSVKSSSWTQELKGLEHEIIKKINDYLHCEVIKEIRFFQKALEKKEYFEDAEQGDPRKKQLHVRLTKEDKEKAEKISSEIEDENLKKAFYEFLTKDMKFQKSIE
jgi:hypothetical protein